jgi:hypothetical protein
VFGLAACEDEETSGPELPDGVTVQVSTNADSVTVTWDLVTEATSYRVELQSTAGDLTRTLGTSDTEAVFTSADGLQDDVTYTAVVYAANEAGEVESDNSPTVLTNFFAWDENYPLSLHVTGQGKMTWYDATPNRGFERFTGVAYQDISCKTCHEPASTGACGSCHKDGNGDPVSDPTLGAAVDASLTGVCGNCHSRQKAEAITHGYSDVHRDDHGMDCMDCHTLEDVHGDGTSPASMLDDGAIGPQCTDCHETVESNGYHNVHLNTVDCSACHIQSVVSCYNCHFETQVDLDVKKAYGQFKDWVFLVNFRGKVHAANFQSVTYGGNTFIAMAPFYAHTIARNARTCDQCHNNAAVQDYVDDGVIDVVTWNAGESKLDYLQGVIPVPPDYLTSLRFDFVDLDQPGGTVWSFLKTGADTIQMVYGEPLTQAQMDKLKQ